MPRSTAAATVAAAALGVAALSACRERRTLDSKVPGAVAASGEAALCAGDSLRPATAAPAQGLWVSDAATAGVRRVVALIGPPGSDDRTLEVRHLVEAIEIGASGDTVRTRREGATVTLELLPPLDVDPLGTNRRDARASTQPAATYVLSPRVWLAAYEACPTSAVGPLVRYLRRDASGKSLTDVMLRRASGG